MKKGYLYHSSLKFITKNETFLSQKSENTFLSQKRTFLVQNSFGQILDSFIFSFCFHFHIISSNYAAFVSNKWRLGHFSGICKERHGQYRITYHESVEEYAQYTKY